MNTTPLHSTSQTDRTFSLVRRLSLRAPLLLLLVSGLPCAARLAGDSGFSLSVRPGVGIGNIKHEVFGPTREKISKLEWSGLRLAETEIAARYDQPTFFVDTRFSGGGTYRGTLDDEDYLTRVEAADPGAALDASLAGSVPAVPAGTKFSDTTSRLQKGEQAGDIGRFSTDVGFFSFNPNPRARLWLTAGYFRNHEEYRAWGLTGIFGLAPNFLSPYPVFGPSVEVIRHDIKTSGFRLGSELQWKLTEHWHLGGRFRVSPWLRFELADSHFLRAGKDVGTTPNFLITSNGNLQLEADLNLNYQLNPRWSFAATVGNRSFATKRIPQSERDVTTNRFTSDGTTTKTYSSVTTFSLGAAYRF